MAQPVVSATQVVTETECVNEPQPEAPEVHVKPNAGLENVDWTGLQGLVSQCQACELYQTRTQTVFGMGHPQADLMLIGEAPGADEDKQGEPFVGRAGKLLDEMLYAIGLDREKVFIANILKCRPPQNRDPRPEEVASCAGFLKRQIELVAPKLIVALGRIAAQNLLQTDTALGKLRGSMHELDGLNVPVLVTYHPAYLLRSPAEKRKSWQDLQRVRDCLQGVAEV